MRQVADLDLQIENARRLRAARPELSEQLGLAEQFYLNRRKALLDLEEPVSVLAGIRQALEALLSIYQAEHLSLEGRLVLLEELAKAGRDISQGFEEIKQRLADLLKGLVKVRTAIQDIKDVLQEYSIECSRPY